jgi:hypothetical protein
LVAIVVARLGSEATADSSYLGLALYALGGKIFALQALATSFFFTQANADLVPTSQYGHVSRYLVVLASLLSVFLRTGGTSGARDRGSIAATLVLGAFLLVHSMLFSVLPPVSVLKALVWLAVVMTILFGWKHLGDRDREFAGSWLYWSLSILVIVSLALRVVPSALLPRTDYLRGIFDHSQVLGLVAAILTVWSLLDAIGSRQLDWLRLSVAALAGFAIIASSARTALIAAVIAMCVALLLAPNLAQQRSSNRSAFRTRGLILLAAGSLSISAVGVSLLFKGDYSSESSSGPGIFEAYERSRGILINPMLENVEQDPFGGIGFGIASNPLKMKVDTYLGVPVGAVVEKGVTPLAMLEEVGALGLALFLFWSFVLVRQAGANGAARLGVVLTILISNLGEASLMSAGGSGLIQLVILGWAMFGSDVKVRRDPGKPRCA